MVDMRWMSSSHRREKVHPKSETPAVFVQFGCAQIQVAFLSRTTQYGSSSASTPYQLWATAESTNLRRAPQFTDHHANGRCTSPSVTSPAFFSLSNWSLHTSFTQFMHSQQPYGCAVSSFVLVINPQDILWKGRTERRLATKSRNEKQQH